MTTKHTSVKRNRGVSKFWRLKNRLKPNEKLPPASGYKPHSDPQQPADKR